MITIHIEQSFFNCIASGKSLAVLISRAIIIHAV